MARKQLWMNGSIALVGALALTAGAAFADDSSMSMWTGDSYAYFNQMDNHPGSFNTARAPHAAEHDAVVRTPREPKAERPVLLAAPSRATRTNPFRDDTAG
jgi:hypothetical protein